MRCTSSFSVPRGQKNTSKRKTKYNAHNVVALGTRAVCAFCFFHARPQSEARIYHRHVEKQDVDTYPVRTTYVQLAADGNRPWGSTDRETVLIVPCLAAAVFVAVDITTPGLVISA